MQILDAMNKDSDLPLNSVRVDGGMTENKLMLQLQADILGIIMVMHEKICIVHTYIVGSYMYYFRNEVKQYAGSLGFGREILIVWE